MTDLHDAGDPRNAAQIDNIGWIFAAVVVVIAAIAGMVAYHGNDVVVASNPVAPNFATSR